MTADPLGAAVQAHAEAEGFISPAGDAWPAMRYAIRTWLEAQVGCDCVEAGRTHPCDRCVVVEVGGVTLRVQTPYLTTFYIDIQDRVVFLPESRVLEADDDR